MRYTGGMKIAEDPNIFDGETIDFDSVRGKADKGLIVNKSQLSRFTGLAVVTIDRMIANGAPIEGKGSRKDGWQINTAKFFAWFWRHKVEQETGDPESQSFDSAKRREKMAHAKLKELEYQKRVGLLIPIERAVAIYQEDAGQQRSRLLAIPASLAQELSVEEDPAEVEAKLVDALNDALADISGDKASAYMDNEDGTTEVGEFSDDFESESGPGNADADADADFDFG